MTVIIGKTNKSDKSEVIIEPARRNTDGSAFIRVDTYPSSARHCYLSRDELKKLIDAAQKIYDDYKLTLPKADAYKGKNYRGEAIYFAETRNPGTYAGGDIKAEDAISFAKTLNGRLGLEHWVSMYGPEITPIYLTKREVVTTETVVSEGDPVTF